MPDFDLLIRGAQPHPAIGIVDGKIVALADGSAREEIDATGLLVLPGAIDAHVHFNEPGRAEWEGIATGSRACAAGGTTTFFDMPLNSRPPVIDAAAFEAKRAIAERESFVDFAVWGGLVPGNLGRIEELHACGVIGLKAFMSHSGIDDFPKADAATLRAGMQRAAELGMLVAVHAEIDHPELRPGTTIRDYLASRTIAIELEAIALAIELAGETGCALHIVHVSSATGVVLVNDGSRAGMDVSCETCPHYLVFNEDDAERIGALAKCAPPIREENEREQLVVMVDRGNVLTIGSDHSPSPMSMKTDADFFKVWGGISGCQHLLALLFDLGLEPGRIALSTSENVADRFRLAERKGRIAPGLDADLVFIDPEASTTVTAESLHYRHRHSPYVGRTLRGRIVRTILRGRTICLDGQIVGEPRGKLLRPAREGGGAGRPGGARHKKKG
jgi:allantoinase